MSVQWEVEYPGMALHGHEVTWTMKNVGDETAHSGTTCGEVTMWQHAAHDAAHDDTHVDSTPWTNPLTLDRDVEPHTAHSMHQPVTWTGQQHGDYTVKITLGAGVEAELYLTVTLYGVELAIR
jgi:hypothetical protein